MQAAIGNEFPCEINLVQRSRNLDIAIGKRIYTIDEAATKTFEELYPRAVGLNIQFDIILARRNAALDTRLQWHISFSHAIENRILGDGVYIYLPFLFIPP